MITVYQIPISPFCDKVRRMLRWKQLPFTVHEMSLLEAMTSYRKVNPIGKVPSIDDDGRRVTDSTDIAYYLDERYPARPLLPPAPAARALCHIIEDWADESLYAYEMYLRLTLPHNARRWMPELTQHEPRALRAVAAWQARRTIKHHASVQGVGRKPLPVVLHDLDRHLDALVGWLGERSWLVGDALTLADIAVLSQVVSIQGSDEGERAIRARPPLSRWMERVDAATAG